MKNKSKFGIILFLFLLCSSQLGSQNIIDSLIRVINTTKYDTVKIDCYNDLIFEYYGADNAQAIKYAKKSIFLAEKVGYNKGLANAHRYLGNVYEVMADYPKALHHAQVSLEIAHDIGFKAAEAASLSNMGSIYERLNDYKKALEYQKQSLALCLELGHKEGTAAVYGNMGNIYTSIGALTQAIEYYEKSLAMNEELGNSFGVALSLGNLGNIYLKKKEYEKAIDYHERSLIIKEEIGHLPSIASSLAGMGRAQLNLGNIEEAKKNFSKSIEIAREIQALPTEKDANLGLYEVYKQLKNYERALLYHEEYTRLNDSVYSTQRNEELDNIRTQYALNQQQKELEQKSQEEKLLLEAKADADHDRQQLIIYATIGGLILVLIFSVFLYNRFAITNKQKKIIEHQKVLVEEKNKQITDSINYAQKIQEAILPQEKDIQNIFPDSFVLFKPKDIVSGDFYWISKISNSEVIYVTADCTGHGVPGGFMSMLGTSFLNEIINEKHVHSPAKILNELREKIIISLKQQGDIRDNKDGMDVVLCKINFDKMELHYAAANNNFYIIREGQLNEFPADKMPIGYFTDNVQSFTEHLVPIRKNDFIVTFTDGYADQFGGADGKKMKYLRFEKLLRENSDNPMNKLSSLLEKELNDWKGDLEQVDDVCVIGIKIA